MSKTKDYLIDIECVEWEKSSLSKNFWEWVLGKKRIEAPKDENE